MGIDVHVHASEQLMCTCLCTYMYMYMSKYNTSLRVEHVHLVCLQQMFDPKLRKDI